MNVVLYVNSQETLVVNPVTTELIRGFKYYWCARVWCWKRGYNVVRVG